MKKFVLVFGLLLSAPIMMGSLTSCSSILKGVNLGSIQNVGKIMDVAKTAQEISKILTGGLGLNSSQQSSVTDIFTDYMGGTNDISSLFGMQQKSYAKQLLSLNNSTFSKLQGVLDAAQYAKLLGLAGNATNASSLLGSLTKASGSNVSKDAANVLSGLLLNGVGGLAK